MAPLTHIPPSRLSPGLSFALAAAGATLALQNLALGLCVILLAGSALLLRAPRPEASCRLGTSVWTVRYGREVITMPLDKIAEVRVDHPLNGPDRVQVLMHTGLCLPLPDAALPPTEDLIAALRDRNIPVPRQ